jgi:rRNA maturation endonuclease Nob1
MSAKLVWTISCSKCKKVFKSDIVKELCNECQAKEDKKDKKR